MILLRSVSVTAPFTVSQQQEHYVENKSTARAEICKQASQKDHGDRKEGIIVIDWSNKRDVQYGSPTLLSPPT